LGLDAALVPEERSGAGTGSGEQLSTADQRRSGLHAALIMAQYTTTRP
jgi:hypothetical protein